MAGLRYLACSFIEFLAFRAEQEGKEVNYCSIPWSQVKYFRGNIGSPSPARGKGGGGFCGLESWRSGGRGLSEEGGGCAVNYALTPGRSPISVHFPVHEALNSNIAIGTTPMSHTAPIRPSMPRDTMPMSQQAPVPSSSPWDIVPMRQPSPMPSSTARGTSPMHHTASNTAIYTQEHHVDVLYCSNTTIYTQGHCANASDSFDTIIYTQEHHVDVSYSFDTAIYTQERHVDNLILLQYRHLHPGPLRQCAIT